MIAKIKELIKAYQNDIILALSLLLVAGIGYNIGHISTSNKSAPITRQELPSYSPLTILPPRDPRVVASKTSKSKIYYYTDCGTANRIKESNKIMFPSATIAEAAGYTLAGNCK